MDGVGASLVDAKKLVDAQKRGGGDRRAATRAATRAAPTYPPQPARDWQMEAEMAKLNEDLVK